MFLKKVVIIDDEVDLCQLLKNYLEPLGYNVAVAHTLRDGLSLISEINPDIIFIDNNLPDGLGWEQVTSLTKYYPDCRINLISAYHSVPEKYLTPHKNVKILEKPLRLQELKTLL